MQRRSWWTRSAIASVATLGLASFGLIAGTGAGTAGAAARAAQSGKPIIIGAVIDETNTMKPFDVPALQAAEIEADKINAAGGVMGRPIKFEVWNDQLVPAQTRADALKAVAAGASILWVTCDVDYATPSIEVGLAHHLLTISPCIGTNQMGPSRFGAAGALAFTFGNAPQSDGAVLARLLMQHGWKTATVVTDHLLTYFIDVCQNFTADYQKMGGKIVSQLSYTTGDHTAADVAQRAADSGADATVLCTTTTPDLVTFVTSLRTLGNAKPIVGPWAIDGGFWEPKSSTISNNIWWSTYASVFGDDPSAAVRSLLAEMKAKGESPLTGGFVTGPSALQGIVTAIDRAHGSLDGATLASIIQSFHDVSTLSGPVSFSTQFHSVVGRPYRIVEVTNDKPHFVEMLSPGQYAAGS
ncbi:MAG TPA: ABC transporter substrate-binding protein [Acidimicrobiales bacterium]|nr:ABC transporter substrate-binding protein [Acidimicrobiales bacterium]